jgi:hypothetical protein
LIENYWKRQRIYHRRLQKISEKNDSFKKPLKIPLEEPMPLKKVAPIIIPNTNLNHALPEKKPDLQILKVAELYNTDLESARVIRDTLDHITKRPSRMCMNYIPIPFNPAPGEWYKKELTHYDKLALTGLRNIEDVAAEEEERHRKWKQKMYDLADYGILGEEFTNYWYNLAGFPQKIEEENTTVNTKKDEGDDEILVPETPRRFENEISDPQLDLTVENCVSKHIEPETRITKLKKKKQILLQEIMYHLFPNIERRLIRRWIRTNRSYGIERNKALMGGYVVSNKRKNNISYVDLLIFGISMGNQAQGLGRKLGEDMTKKFKRILAWVDQDAILFYRKLGFSPLITPQNHEKLLFYQDNSVMMHKGFEDDELHTLRLKKENILELIKMNINN